MGDVIHDAVIVVASDYVWREGFINVNPPDVEAFRQEMPAQFRPILVGPVIAPMNGYHIYMWAPDGSKEGWDASDLADEWRARFVALWSFKYPDGSSPYDVAEVRFGPSLYMNHLPPEIKCSRSYIPEDAS